MDFILLRSAELTLEHGFKYFIIMDSKEYSYYSITPKSTAGSYIITKPVENYTIICFYKKPHVNNTTIIYNAKFIIKSIKTKYGIN